MRDLQRLRKFGKTDCIPGHGLKQLLGFFITGKNLGMEGRCGFNLNFISHYPNLSICNKSILLEGSLFCP